MTGLKKIRRKADERGFTLLETLLVVGLTTLIAVGIVAALFEGLDTLQTVADTQSVEFGHQRIMDVFLTDVKNAEFFYNGTTHDSGGSIVSRTNVSNDELVLGYDGPEGNEVWVRYRLATAAFNQDAAPYLTRTVMTDIEPGDGASYLTPGIANLDFTYYDESGREVFELADIHRIIMTVSLEIGGTAVERSYEATMRNANQGVRVPPRSFDDIDAEWLGKNRR